MISQPAVYPAAPSERIVSLDLLRGIAVLGILIMNIQSFSMISAAYMNPAAWGDLTGLNKWVWIVSHVVASDKFMSIFSMLFGAGMILFTTKALDKGHRAGPLHYRRMLWLLIFGMMHAYLIWYGDILVAYALCGMLVFVFRKKTVKTLLIIGSAFFLVPEIMTLFAGATIDLWPQESIEENMKSWQPALEAINRESAIRQGGWLSQMEFRVPQTIFMQTFVFFWFVFWRVMAMMLLGMALYKSGVLSAKKSSGFYLRMAVIGILTGYTLSGLGVYENFKAGWELAYSRFYGSMFNYFGSLASALGYVGIVMLIAKSDIAVGFKRLMSFVGKMAFTNYILMSLLMMFIFYGNGLGLLGKLERGEQMLVVVGIWLVILVISPIWLNKFRFGPLEWFWRVLTYWRIQPINKSTDR